jgi:HK97 family phage portal protein
MTTPWDEIQTRAKEPGSPILNRWLAERQAARGVRAEGYTAMPDIRRGTELFEWLSGGMSSAGVAVTEQTAMRVSAVYACVNLIGGALASLPLPIYERTPDGRQRADHAYWWLLNEQPTDTMSAAVFWEYLAASLLLNGDAFARILRPSLRSTKVDGLEPYPKSRVTVHKQHGLLFYELWNEDRTQVEIVEQADMVHIPGPGFDGKNGMSQIRHALRNSAGIALAADEYSAAFFKNGARPDFAIEVGGSVNEEQQEMLRRSWADKHSGVGKSHLPALLVNGAKVHELTMNAEDAQLIDTRRFQVEDIARIFGVPPWMIGHTQATTSWGSGIEQMGIGFVKYTLQRHLVKFEQELNRKLWPTRSRYFVEFTTAGLERGDYKSRNEGYRIALGRAGEPAWMTVNEVRRIENMPPIEGGDTIPKGNADEAPAQTPG